MRYSHIPPSSLPEFMNFKLFGKTSLVVNLKFGLFWAIHSGSECLFVVCLSRMVDPPEIRQNKSEDRFDRLEKLLLESKGSFGSESASMFFLFF